MTDEQPETPASPTFAEPGSLEDLVERLGRRLGVVAIDEVWLFPARKAGAGENTLFVVSAFEEDLDRRRVYTAQFAVSRDSNGAPIVEENIEVQASAPAERVPRVIDGVVRRMADELSVPRYARIAGDMSAWQALRLDPRLSARE
jgi:hypothetical protein